MTLRVTTPLLATAWALAACSPLSTPAGGQPVTGVYTVELIPVQDSCREMPAQERLTGAVFTQDDACNLPSPYFWPMEFWGSYFDGRDNFPCEVGYGYERHLDPFPACETGVANYEVEIVFVSRRRVDVLYVREYSDLSGCDPTLYGGFEGSCRMEYLVRCDLDTPCEPPCELFLSEDSEAWDTENPYTCSCPDQP
jgi:hypothetical protein